MCLRSRYSLLKLPRATSIRRQTELIMTHFDVIVAGHCMNKNVREDCLLEAVRQWHVIRYHREGPTILDVQPRRWSVAISDHALPPICCSADDQQHFSSDSSLRLIRLVASAIQPLRRTELLDCKDLAFDPPMLLDSSIRHRPVTTS